VAKDLKISVLLDFYGNMLTDKQRDVLELYYNEDLSLGEIGNYEGISRQGVRDSIKRGEAVLLELEEKLGLYEKTKKLDENLKEIFELALKIEAVNDKFFYSADITAAAKEIQKKAEKSLEATV
jgi:predicted DNA-binding protein YlxM (UPF0122 family)